MKRKVPKSNILLIISLIILAIILLLLLSQFLITTGNVVQDSNLQKVGPRAIYYEYLRVPVNSSYLESCFPKGEVMPVIPDAKCCAGLQEILIIDKAQKQCSPVTGVSFCSSCGDGLCDYGEDNCNCPEDCNAPPQ